jgi:hypothetical protein
MFEKADVSTVLDVREELSEYLGSFREAVAISAATIESASWEVERFAEESELVFRENVAPAVEHIEERVEGDPDLKELSYRYGGSLLGAGAATIGAFVGGGPALADLVALAAGLAAAGWQAVAAGRSQRKEMEGERLYFYYRAARSFGRVR